MFTKEAYMEMEKAGLISVRRHPERESMVILNYTPETVYDRMWNEITLASRGLILDEVTGEVAALPFKKFFNYGEIPDAELPEGKPEITVKQDGSLGISYRLDGKIFWATRGSFVSDQAAAAQALWEEKYSEKKIPEELTLLTEIIHPVTRVVVPYNFSDLVLIGARNRFTGKDFIHDELLVIGKELGMPVTERVEESLESVLARRQTLHCTEEGFVLRWPNGYRLKIKGEEYLRIHKIMYGLSDKMKAQFWLEDRLEELIRYIPEEFREEIEEFGRNLSKEADDLILWTHSMYAIAPKETRKEFAIWVNQNIPNNRHLLFLLADGSFDVQKVKETVLKSKTWKKEVE